MSGRDLQRIQVLSEVTNRRRAIASAAVVLALSARQVRRLLKAYCLGGGSVIAHKARSRPSNNRIQDGVRDYALALVREAYADFGPTLAAEKLAERHNLRLGVETLRRWVLADGIWMGRASTPMSPT